MAEWSKALVLGTSLFGGVGSNPTSNTIFTPVDGMLDQMQHVRPNRDAKHQTSKKVGSPGMDSNHRPRDRCCGYTIYSPPLYQLSYGEIG